MDLIHILISLPIFWYVAVPVVIKLTMKINARPGIQPVTPKFLPDDVQDYFNEVAPKLSALSFEPAACFVMAESLANITPYVQLWVNRRSGQLATANVVITKNSGERPTTVKSHLEFLTKLSSGPAIVTNNSDTLGAFKKTSASETLSARRLKDPAQLHRLHAWRESQLAPAAAERFIPAAGEELEWFADVYEESIVRQVGTGYVQVESGDPTVYHPTFHGAYLMTWAQMWPMKGLRRSAEDRRADTMVRQCSAAGAAGGTTPIRINQKRSDRGPGRRAA
jgi:hypothetical protein